MTYDVLVIGAGPAGLHAGQRLASAGFHVLVCEEHGQIGDPVHCTGVLGADVFDELDVPRAAVLNVLSTVRFVSPSGATISYTTPDPEAVVIDRGRFDHALAEDARRAGAEVRTHARVADLEVEADGVSATAGGTPVRARLVVLACGASYAVQRRLGLGCPTGLLHTAQRELPAERLMDVEVHFGTAVATEGFAWAVPVERPDGAYVRVGIMASRDALRGFHRMVERLAESWGVVAPSESPRQKILPTGPIARTVSDRVLVVGDAAGLVKPTTGGGIYYSLVSASIAAEVGGEALRTNRLDAESLAPYEHRWREQLEDELDAQSELRHVAASMSDRDIESLFDLVATDGIMPIVRKTARFNQHRHLIRALFMYPPARNVLFRALVG